jgi:hypothetical protein
MAKSARKKVIRRRKSVNQTNPYTAKGVEASQLRRRRGILARRFGIPQEILGGSLNQVTRKCGKTTCRCASGEGHPMWTLTYSVNGRRHVEFVPNDLVPQLAPLSEEGRDYRDALHEILTLNAQLVTLWRRQQSETKKQQTTMRRRAPRKKGLSKDDPKRTTDR